MKKALLPLTIALAAAPMASMADVTVYGRANVSVDLLDNGADYSELNMSSNSSRLGFRANRDFDGVTAIMQIEQQVDYDAGVAFSSNRDTFVGLRGDFGTVRLGRFDTPFKRARGPANLFGDAVGEMRNLTRVGDARFDERNANTLHYQTPKLGDLQFNIAYSISEAITTQDNSDDSISMSVTYTAGALDLAAGFETYGQDHSRGERDSFRLAGAYSVTPDLTLVAFYQNVDMEGNDALTSDLFGFGGEYKLTGKTRVKAHYFTRTTGADDYDSDLFAVGIEHRIDSSLRLYSNYSMVSNDANIALTPYNQARTTSGIPAVNGEDTSGLSVGLRYDF